MKKTIKSILALMLAVMICAAFMPAAFAATDGEVPEDEPEVPVVTKTPSVTINVKKGLTGTLPPVAEEFVFNMEADDPSYPMPEGSENGLCTISIKGAGDVDFPAITYDHVGIYTYTVYETPGKNVKCTYDKTVYHMVVSVTNNADYTGLETTVALHVVTVDKETKEEVDEKVDEVKFINRYKFEPPATGDNSDLGLWVTLMTVCAVGAASVLVVTKRKEN